MGLQPATRAAPPMASPFATVAAARRRPPANTRRAIVKLGVRRSRRSMIRKSQGTDPGHEGHDLLRRPARAQLPLWQRLLVLRLPDGRADRALFLFLHRFVKFLELLLFARQVFGKGGVIKVCDVGMDRFHQPQKALILDQLAEALAKRRNTISGRAFGNEHAAPEVEHDVDAGLTAG